MTTQNLITLFSSGSHAPGDGAACVMEFVSLLAGEKWSDSPACTHRLLASVARKVNDRMSNKNRHLMIPLIGRLVGTAVTGTLEEQKLLNVGLAVFSAKSVLHLVNPKRQAKAAAAIASAEAWIAEPCERTRKGAAAYAAYAAYAAAAYAAAYDKAMVDALSALIDEYDRLTGRTEVRILTDQELISLNNQLVTT